jgi:GTP-binding protein HflX
MVLADTVGFVRHLPHQLVEAFRATLEEAQLADLLLHVIDASAADREDTSFEVEKVLGEIGADKVRRLDVYNKIDLLEAAPRIDRGEDGKPARVWVSAQSGAGLDLLREAIAELLEQDLVQECLPITPAQGRLRARLYEKGAVLAEHVDEQGQISLEIRLPRVLLAQLLAAENADAATRPVATHF